MHEASPSSPSPSGEHSGNASESDDILEENAPKTPPGARRVKCCVHDCAWEEDPPIFSGLSTLADGIAQCDVCDNLFHERCRGGFKVSESESAQRLLKRFRYDLNSVRTWCGCLLSGEQPRSLPSEDSEPDLESRQQIQASGGITGGPSQTRLYNAGSQEVAAAGAEGETIGQPGALLADTGALLQGVEGNAVQTRKRKTDPIKSDAFRGKFFTEELDKIQKSMILLKRRLGFDLALVGIGKLNNREAVVKVATPGLEPFISPQWADPNNTLPAVRKQVQLNIMLLHNHSVLEKRDLMI